MRMVLRMSSSKGRGRVEDVLLRQIHRTLKKMVYSGNLLLFGMAGQQHVVLEISLFVARLSRAFCIIVRN